MKQIPMLAGLAAVLIGASPASAKQTEPTPSAKAPTVSGVTVEAQPKENPLVDPATQFVREHLPEGQSEQIARFRDDVCVKVVGLPPELDAFIARRLIEVAGQVRAPLAKAADCAPNVNVVFTANPQAQLDDIAKRKDILLGFHFVAQTKKLTTVDRPVQAWYVTRTRDATGNSWIEVNHPVPVCIPDCENPIPESERPMGRAGSRLGNGMSAEVVHSLILADTNKLAGAKIEVVADYIAVLALAKWQGLNRCNATPTILNRMADGCDDPPEAATPQDLALLSGLYAVEARESGAQQRAAIASAIRKASRH
jgi:hypothetical protein